MLIYILFPFPSQSSLAGRSHSDHVRYLNIRKLAVVQGCNCADIVQSSRVPESCRGCSKKLDWDFVKEFYDRERYLMDQIHQLNHQVAASAAALQHAGSAALDDRAALNAAHAQLDTMQHSYAELQVTLARVSNKSHEESQELRQLQESSYRNRLQTLEMERNLDCVWKAHARMGEIVSHCASHAEDVSSSPVDVGRLVMELESKSLRIRALEEERDQASREAADERETHALSLQEPQARTMELQRVLQPGSAYNLNSQGNEHGSRQRRKRHRRRTQADAPREANTHTRGTGDSV